MVPRAVFITVVLKSPCLEGIYLYMGVSIREALISVLPFYLPFINRMSIKWLVTLGSIKPVVKHNIFL